MKTLNLSHVTAASAVAHCIANQPATPVVAHWQMPDFPVRVARALVEQKHSIIWIVATAERADIAVRELTKAGITVNQKSTEALKAGLNSSKPLTPMQLVRRKLKEAMQFPPPGTGTITVVSIHNLRHSTPLSEIVGWKSPLAVFDHIGSLNARWLTVDLDAGEGNDVETTPEEFKPSRAENTHPIPVFRGHQIPMVFLTRDEFEVVLLRADFERWSCPTTLLGTRYVVPPKLKVFVVGTELVMAKYAVGAFLGVLASSPEAQVVGQALIGATTPDKLSMSTTTPLKKAVLKISHQHKKLIDAGEIQTKLTVAELRDMRIRDYVRTAVLAFDPASRKPELVILCPWDMAATVADNVAVRSRARLTKLSPTASVIEGEDLSAFAKSVIAAAQSYLTVLDHGNRLHRISEAIATVKKADLPKRISQFAVTLHSVARVGSRLDLTARPETFAGHSERQNRVIGVFNKVLDLAYPWSQYAPGSYPDNLRGRVDVMRRYRKHWAKHAAKQATKEQVNN